MIDVTKIEKIMRLMQEHGVDVVQADSGTERINLARQVGQGQLFAHQSHQVSSFGHSAADHATPVPSQEPVPAAAPAATPTPKASAIPAGEVIKSPFVGTFYRTPNPESPPFVEVGTRVRKGQALCIVEAMKLMNEIESEWDGEIIAILVENGKPVEFGTPLFVLSKGN